MGYVYISKIYFDFLKRIIPHTPSALKKNISTASVRPPQLSIP